MEKFIRYLTTPQAGVSTIEIFCAMTDMNFTEFFVKPAGNKANFDNIKQMICMQPGLMGLLDDVKQMTAGNLSYFESIVSMRFTSLSSEMAVLHFCRALL